MAIKDEISIITEQVHVGSLATINEDGSPWSSPLHFAFTDTMVYWLSSEKTQHSQNIARDGRVSIVLWLPSTPPNVKGVYVQSEAALLTGPAEITARQLYKARFGGGLPDDFYLAEIYGAPLGEIDETKTRGGRIYFKQA